MPPGVVTVTSTVPTLADGADAVSWVADLNVTEVAALEPKSTVAPETKFVPVIVTIVPPAIGPAAGLTALTVGRSYPYWSAEEMGLVPPGVVTVTLTVPGLADGAVAASWVVDLNVTEVAGLEPKSTVAPETKFVPVIVTVFPPAVGPPAGLTLVTVGVAS